MAQLFMDTDQLRNSMASIHTVQNQMMEQVRSLTQQIDYLVGVTWQAPAAIHFGNDFASCQETIVNLLGELEGLVIDLNREIDEWEEAGNSFNRSTGGLSHVARSARYFPFSG